MNLPAQIDIPAAEIPGPDGPERGPGAMDGLPGLPAPTVFSACLKPFLDALGWMGEGRHLVEAHPHFDQIDGLDTLRTMLIRLGVQSRVHRVAIPEIGTDDLPCIALLAPDHPVVILERIEEDVFVVFDTESDDLCEYVFDDQRLTCCFATPIHAREAAPTRARFSWFANALRSFRGPIVVIFGLTFAANLLALATPVYIMNVYNLVIGAGMLGSLGIFLAALCVALGFEFYLRRRRGLILAYSGARFSAALLSTSFQRILGLPVALIESASVGSQVLRLKQFEGIHNLFTGALATAVLDLPFVVLFFVAIAAISPVLILVPLGLLAIYAALACVLVPVTRRNTKELNELQARNQTFLIDTISNLTTIQQLRGEAWWHRRYAALSRELETKRFRVQFLDAVVTQGAQTLVMLAGVATLFIGAHLVMQDALSIGGLIAVMMFIWRVLSPAQTLFVGLNKVSQFASSVRQVNALMAIPPERPEERRRTVFRSFEGRITFDRVSFRYEPAQEPILRGLSVDIQPGEMVAITSPSAGGKSTILKMILGLYQPQAGTVFLDRLNLQQLDVHEVRSSIGYTHLEPVFFYGTLAQNMRLANPTATDEMIEVALDEAGIDLSGRMFPKGLGTMLTNAHLAMMSDSLRQSLSLARMYGKRASINLFNDPGALLDEPANRALKGKLAALKGAATTVIVTNRRSHLALCDRVLVLKDGAVSTVAPPRPDASAGRDPPSPLKRGSHA